MNIRMPIRLLMCSVIMAVISLNCSKKSAGPDGGMGNLVAALTINNAHLIDIAIHQ